MNRIRKIVCIVGVMPSLMHKKLEEDRDGKERKRQRIDRIVTYFYSI